MFLQAVSDSLLFNKFNGYPLMSIVLSSPSAPLMPKLQAASELIRSSVDPILDQYIPVMLASLKFSKFTLGTVAPQYTGVSILESTESIENGPDKITMELGCNVMVTQKSCWVSKPYLAWLYQLRKNYKAWHLQKAKR